MNAGATTGSFILVGDTQRTMGIERLLGREQNDDERDQVIEAISRESVGFVFFLGDMVDVGGKKKSWTYFDRLTKPIRDAGLTEYGLRGNHEYFGDVEEMRAETQARFTNLRDAGYGSVRNGPIELIFLDSNHKPQVGAAWDEQKAWLAKELARVDADTSIRGAFVLMHHPPYTNSWIVSEDKWVRADLLPLIVTSKKVIATATGHAHAYEHFFEQGKHFIVSGGGGGARQELRQGFFQRRKDLFPGGMRRPFNYLRIDPREGGVTVNVLGLEKNSTKLGEIDRFDIDYPK